MNEQMILSIPVELIHPFFFSTNDHLTLDKDDRQNLNPKVPFLYEAAFFSKIDALKPWQMHEQCIPLLINEWSTEKVNLEKLFTIRDYKNTLAPMKKGIGLFLQFVYWANDNPVNFQKPFTSEDLKVQPVNMGERIGFIIQRPTLYHSFAQLNELMIEMEKQYVKHMAIKKASKHKA
ncbi:YpoC family protein [Cytobacillus sp. FJAT-53684]|uniref:YpoC family protein n=1 Tax=Cytobacillus mangrovibacter TaxID=3299024 RepID=A0ABW6JUY4_9BACI